MPVPKKKSLDVQRQKALSGLGLGYGPTIEGDYKDAIQLQEYDGPGWRRENQQQAWDEGRGVADAEVESPAQVFVYDPVTDRYVKESSPQS